MKRKFPSLIGASNYVAPPARELIAPALVYPFALIGLLVWIGLRSFRARALRWLVG